MVLKYNERIAGIYEQWNSMYWLNIQLLLKQSFFCYKPERLASI